MKRFAYLILLFIGTYSAAMAQEVRYKIKRDNPEDVKNLIIHLDPWFADVYFTNLAMGFSARADWLINKVVDVSVEWRRPYFDMNWLEASTYKLADEVGGADMKDMAYMPQNGFSQYTYLEPTIRLHLSDKIKETNHHLVLSKSSYSSGNNNYSNTQFINVPGKSRKIVSFEGAACWLDVPVLYKGLFNSNPSDFQLVHKETGIVLPATEDFGGTMMRTLTFIGGFSFQRLDNLKALTDKYGVKYSTAWTNFYFDVLYAPVVNFDHVVDDQGLKYEVTNQKVNRLGWRLGYALKNTKGTALSMKFNVGNRPGFEGDNPYFGSRFYMDFNFGVSIANKVKRSTEEKK